MLLISVSKKYNLLQVFEPEYDNTNVFFWLYDYDLEEFKSAGAFNVKGLADLFYLATMKDKVAILTNIDDDMIRDPILCIQNTESRNDPAGIDSKIRRWRRSKLRTQCLKWLMKFQ